MICPTKKNFFISKSYKCNVLEIERTLKIEYDNFDYRLNGDTRQMAFHASMNAT